MSSTVKRSVCPSLWKLPLKGLWVISPNSRQQSRKTFEITPCRFSRRLSIEKLYLVTFKDITFYKGSFSLNSLPGWRANMIRAGYALFTTWKKMIVIDTLCCWNFIINVKFGFLLILRVCLSDYTLMFLCVGTILSSCSLVKHNSSILVPTDEKCNQEAAKKLRY